MSRLRPATLVLVAGFWTGLVIGPGVGFGAETAARAAGIADVFDGIYWGESSSELLARFGSRATALALPIDFGDSYAQIVLRSVVIGGVPLVGFFQMDKTTHGLRRIQLERQRHGVSPPVFRAIVGALEAAWGAPDLMCGIAPGPAGGYQKAAERVWRRDGLVIRAIFRDTTIEAFEGCLAGDPSGDPLLAGPCGLTGQILVRISPSGPPRADTASCTAPAHPTPSPPRKRGSRGAPQWLPWVPAFAGMTD
jgi:hypothetical protein